MVLEGLQRSAVRYYEEFEDFITPEKMRKVEKISTLKALDALWTNHLAKVEELQEAALIYSISQPDFFEEYERQMNKEYQRLLFAAPRVICRTVLRTIARLWQEKSLV